MLSAANQICSKIANQNMFIRFQSQSSFKWLIDDTPERSQKLKEYLDQLNNEHFVPANSKYHESMFYFNEEARKITCEINSQFHTTPEIQELFALLTNKPVERTLCVCTPIYTNFGKNITIGKNIFINTGCHFQDMGGITIGDNVLIGQNVCMATLNHDLNPMKRGDMIALPIKIGNNVWIGSNATILPGVTIGENSVIASCSLVNKDVPPNTVVAGIPAKIIKKNQHKEEEQTN